MQKKDTKFKVLITFSVLVLAIALMAEVYAMINYPQDYIILAAGAVVALLFLFFAVHGVLSLRTNKELRREEQYDSIFKSEKASYLILKKNFDNLDAKMDALSAATKGVVEELSNTQKGVAKVIINRNKENADALIASSEIMSERMDEIEQKIADGNQAILDNQRGTFTESLNAVIAKQQELVESIKDMEIRLNQAIMQTQEAISNKPIQVTANVAIPAGVAPVAVAPPVVAEPVAEVVEEAVAEPVVEAVEEVVAEPVAEAVEEVVAEPVVEAVEAVAAEPVAETVEEAVAEPEEVSEEITEEAIAEAVEEVAIEEAVEAATEVDLTESEPAPVVEEPAPEPTPAPVAEEPVDPNKKLSPEEIAAMFASAAGDSAPAEPEPTPAPVAEEPVDPNKKLSPEEIAAMFASAAGESAPAEPAPEPVVEEPTPEPEPEAAPALDLSDPNKKLSPDEIAALIASM